MINKVILIGYVGKDPESRTSPAGLVITSFSLATTEKYKNKQTNAMEKSTEWFRVITFDNPVISYIKKGSKIYIEGKLKTRKYTDKSGVEKSITEVIANTIQLLDKKEEEPLNQIQQTGNPDWCPF